MVLDERTIAKILFLWNINPLKITLVDHVWRIETVQGPLCLKGHKARKNFDAYLSLALNHLYDQGFTKMPYFFSTNKGEIFLHYQKTTFRLFEWIDGRPVNYTQVEDLIASVQTLAEFHKAAQGLILPSFLKVKSRLDYWPKKLKERTQDLERYQKTTKSSDSLSDIASAFLPQADWLIAQAHYSMQIINSNQYQELANHVTANRTYTHGDIAANNIIINQSQAYLIDFEALAADLRIVDIWRLLSRCLWAVNWDRAYAQLILKIYHSYYPLTPTEFDVLMGFMSFPQLPWRLAHRYIEQNDQYALQEYQKISPLLGPQGVISECLTSLLELGHHLGISKKPASQIVALAGLGSLFQSN